MPRSRSRSPRASSYDRSDRDKSYRSAEKSSRSSRKDRSPHRSSRRRSRSRTPTRDEDEYGRRRRRDDHRRASDSGDERRDRKRSKKDKKKHKKSKKERYSGSEEDESEDDMNNPKLDELGYTNVSNPFNDVNLESKFQWAKKKEKERKSGLTSSDMKRRESDRKRETEEELAKLNKRRAEREIEMELREEERTRMQRDTELAQMGDWKAKEDEFHLEQAKKRAEIRIREGRAKPIDILAMNMRLANEADKVEEAIDLEVDLDEPYTIFDNLSLAETEELHRDIQMYLDLEKNEESLEFWRAMLIVSADIIEKMTTDPEQRALGGVSESVKSDIAALLSNKTLDQLTALQSQVTKKLQSNEPIDVEYWENLLKELFIYKAKAKLRDMHQVLLTKRLEQLRLRQRLEAEKVQKELEEVLAMHGQVRGRGVQAGEGLEAEPVDEELAAEQDKRFEEAIENDEADESVRYERGMSPELFTKLSNEDKELEIINPEDDLKCLLEARRKVMSSKVIPARSKPKVVKQETAAGESASVATNVLFDQEAAKGIDEDEEMFNIEEELAKEAYLWQDKYRPRKPRYFNRVHTGYEWNKYNQTHYDQDNPPPKVVQGYKFNIFYPDLIDKSNAPTYFIEKDPSNPEIVTIRFHAGPPYEDVAFRIVNREWEYSHKKGFKSAFDRALEIQRMNLMCLSRPGGKYFHDCVSNLSVLTAGICEARKPVNMLRLATLWLPRPSVLSAKGIFVYYTSAFQSIPCLPINEATVISRGFATAARHERNKTNVLTRQLQQQLQSKDVILYEAPPSAQRTFLFMYISAGVQLLFWGNLASLAYVSYGTKESDEEDAPYVLAPTSKRIGIASALCAVGVGISAAMCLYPWRYINRLWLLKGGTMARFETCAKGIDSHKVREFSVNNLKSSQRVFTGIGPKGTDAINSSSSHIFLRPTRARMGYILDRKGQFRDPKLFDGIFHR